MSKKMALPAKPPEDGAHGRIVAIVVGIEDYQDTPNGPTLPKVDFARNDTKAIAKALESIYPPDRLDLQVLIDSQATASTLDYTLKQTIESLTADDLFVFYYTPDTDSTAQAAIESLPGTRALLTSRAARSLCVKVWETGWPRQLADARLPSSMPAPPRFSR